MFSTVVVGADHSATALQAVQTAIDLVGLTGGTLHIVTGYKRRPASVGGENAPEGVVSSVGLADSLLEDLASRARTAGVAVETHVVRDDPEDAIVQVAEAQDADLVVVGNKGMKGVRRVMGSVPNAVAHKAPCSVLIVETT